jgi:hypothetical protein
MATFVFIPIIDYSLFPPSRNEKQLSLCELIDKANRAANAGQVEALAALTVYAWRDSVWLPLLSAAQPARNRQIEVARFVAYMAGEIPSVSNIVSKTNHMI